MLDLEFRFRIRAGIFGLGFRKFAISEAGTEVRQREDSKQKYFHCFRIDYYFSLEKVILCCNYPWSTTAFFCSQLSVVQEDNVLDSSDDETQGGV